MQYHTLLGRVLTRWSAPPSLALGIALIGSAAQGHAQGRFSLLAEAQLHRSYSRFRGDALVSNRLELHRMSGRAAAVGLQFRHTPRLSYKLSLGMIGYGLAYQFRRDAPGGRKWEATGTGRSFLQSPWVNLGAVYVLSDPAKKHWWLAEAGLELLGGIPPSFKLRKHQNLVFTNDFLLSAGNDPRPGAPMMVGRTTETHYRISRPGLRLGIGHEWKLGRRHYAAAKLVGCLGLMELARWQMDYATWDIAPDVDAVVYRNEISSNMSWVGTQVSYRFGL